MDGKTAFLTVFRFALQHQPLPEIPEATWPEVLEMADRQHVYALIGDKMAEIPAFCESAFYEQVLKKAVRHTFDQEKRDAQFLRLYKAMKKSGLHPLVMKGLACRAAYETQGMLRPSGDEDLLISSREFQAAWKALEEMGYHAAIKDRPPDTEQVHHVLFQNENNYTIELHVRPVGVGNAFFKRMDRYLDDAHNRAVRMAWKGEEISTLCPTDHYLLLIFHMAKHLCGLGIGIRLVADMAVYYTRHVDEIQQEVVQAALDTCGLTLLYCDLVYIANHHLGFSLPETQAAVCPDQLLAHMLDGGVLGPRNTTGLVTSAVVQYSFANHHRPGKTLWRVIFPSRAQVLQHDPASQDKPLRRMMYYPKRWARGARILFHRNSASPLRSLQSTRERMHLLKRYGIE